MRSQTTGVSVFYNKVETKAEISWHTFIYYHNYFEWIRFDYENAIIIIDIDFDVGDIKVVWARGVSSFL